MEKDKEPIRFTIPMAPVTKKNHGNIVTNKKTGKPMYIPSKQYKAYAEAAGWFIPQLHINSSINIKAIYYKKTHRKSDLINFHQALFDIMKDYGAIEDDNDSIIISTDGSRVRYDKDNPRTEVEITFIQEESL